MPSEIFGLGVSQDGNHYALGLNDGSLIVRSKQLEEAAVDEEQELFSRILQPTMKATSKNYKYFFRGQYVTPSIDDLIAEQKQRKAKLQPFEVALKKFQYNEALLEALRRGSPELVSALAEELVERGGLEIALAGFAEDDLVLLIELLSRKAFDYRF